MSLFRTIKALLPNGAAWRIVVDKMLRRFFEGLAESPEETKDYADEILLDAFPSTTRQLPEWERQFGIPSRGAEATRRSNVAVEWAATGGQSPRYIQDQLQAAGFDLYVHEWPVDPDANPRVPHDPRDYTNPPLIGIFQCFDGPGAPECFDGPGAPYCNDFLTNDPGYLVNKDLTPRPPPPIPADPATWPFFIYIGAETFPNRAEVDTFRRAELERLLLKIRPAHVWIVMLIDYVGGAILVDDNDNILVDDDYILVS